MDDGFSRRDFLKAAGRILVLGGLGLLAARLLRGSGGGAGRGRPLEGQTCINQGVCRGCAAYAQCRLPAALSAKERLGRGRQLG